MLPIKFQPVYDSQLIR